ncbi:MAG: hydrogenase 3 maturation endopeptidase HyCI [candidate division WOR-3 bacterium]
MAKDLLARGTGNTRPVVVVGVGNRLRGDDGIGPALLDALAGFEQVCRFDVGSTPENFILPIAQLKPGRIMVVDACDFGGQPGEFRLFDQSQVEQLAYGLLSTHTLPLSLTVEMLAQETRAEVVLLGIQPADIRFGADLSEPVRSALPALIAFVQRWAADEPERGRLPKV